jgi:predicted DNA-binding protein (MmcQ/YjbR family)
VDDDSITSILQHLTGSCATWPEVEISSETGQHSAFRVRGRTFAYFLVDHHGDGRVAINVKAPAGVQPGLVASDPARYYVPAYLGARGWVGYDFTAAIDWPAVDALLAQSYRLVAPARLARTL